MPPKLYLMNHRRQTSKIQMALDVASNIRFGWNKSWFRGLQIDYAMMMPKLSNSTSKIHKKKSLNHWDRCLKIASIIFSESSPPHLQNSNGSRCGLKCQIFSKTQISPNRLCNYNVQIAKIYIDNSIKPKLVLLRRGVYTLRALIPY